MLHVQQRGRDLPLRVRRSADGQNLERQKRRRNEEANGGTRGSDSETDAGCLFSWFPGLSLPRGGRHGIKRRRHVFFRFAASRRALRHRLSPTGRAGGVRGGSQCARHMVRHVVRHGYVKVRHGYVKVYHGYGMGCVQCQFESSVPAVCRRTHSVTNSA